MSAQQLLDAAGRPRSPATMPGHHAGRIPAEQGPPVPGRSADGRRDRRGHAPGRRRSSRPADARPDRRAMARGPADPRGATLAETDLNERRGSLLIRHGKGDRRREVGMDPWAWSVLAGWTSDRIALPRRAAVLRDRRSHPGRAWSATAVRAELRHLAIEAGVRRRFAPHH